MGSWGGIYKIDIPEVKIKNVIIDENIKENLQKNLWLPIPKNINWEQNITPNEIHTIDRPRIKIKNGIIDDETKAILAKNLSLLTKKKYKNIHWKQKTTPNETETIIDTIEQWNIKHKDTIWERRLIQNRTLSKEKQWNTESRKVIKKDKIIRSR